MDHELRCPDHPKYDGHNKIKRIDKCEGCRAVRMAYEERLEKKRSQGTGPFPSLTSPNFNCGLVHVFAEMATLMVHGYQPPFFWRKGSKATQEVRDFYKDAYNVILGFLERNPNAKQGIPRFLWQTVMVMRAKSVRDGMEKDHEIRQDRAEEFKELENNEPVKDFEPTFKPKKNILLED